MDFMHDSTEGGRKIRLLNIVDDYTREALWMEVSTSITGAYVTRVLDQLVELRGKPNRLLTDNGPEFAGAALNAWTYANQIEHQFISQGNPIRTHTWRALTERCEMSASITLVAQYRPCP